MKSRIKMIESIYNIKPSDIKAQVALSNADGREDEYFGPAVTAEKKAAAIEHVHEVGKTARAYAAE